MKEQLSISGMKEQHSIMKNTLCATGHVAAVISLVISLLSLCPVHAQTWGDINYDGKPWVSNVSEPHKATRGLQNRHLTLWASHGRYYSRRDSSWQWQRPNLFTTREDLFTQTIVVPYLIPMLENAGAVVFTPRERDWQRHEVIVDNDDHQRLVNYQETGFRKPWTDTPLPGFAQHGGTYTDGENPFTAGTARMAESTRSKSKTSQISYQPVIPEAGSYAVYVSYQTLPGSIDDAHYVVWHQGQPTEFRVNQQMGGSTWVYLGTFHFDKGCDAFNRVVVTNHSSHGSGIVTSDAVRFGGGMGNIQRGGSVSGLPRALEGARYTAQWAGMPYSVYSSKDGLDDYGDDINARSLMLNYLAGGSCYVPQKEGLGVPMELSLAVHSDAGFDRSGEKVYGTLTICTTDNYGDSLFNNGLPRTMSTALANDLLRNTTNDLRRQYGRWTAREVRDRNYSESRNPEVPSAILETLSHQNFTDMCYGLDPNFRFQLARSVYKTLLRYVCRNHGDDCTVTPLAPTDLRIELSNPRRGEAVLSWTPVSDPQEPDADATAYIVYTATGHADFDNGQLVHGTSHTVRLTPGELHSFRVAAVNRGGRSFPTAVVSAHFSPTARKTIVIVDGFQRLASPAVRNTAEQQGFDIDRDMGVSYGTTAGWAGRQLVFDRSKAGVEDSTGLGYGTDDLAGLFIAGNTFDYVKTHAEDIHDAQVDCNIVSCNRGAVEKGLVDLRRYDMADLILGLERADGYSLGRYQAFTTQLATHLQEYTRHGGSLLTSGAYVGSEMSTSPQQAAIADVTKCRFTGTDSYGATINGLGQTFDIWRLPNEQHYCAPATDILEPATQGAMSVMAYADGYSAAVAYQGSDYRALTVGFPLECIQSKALRTAIMQGIVNYLINK